MAKKSNKTAELASVEPEAAGADTKSGVEDDVKVVYSKGLDEVKEPISKAEAAGASDDTPSPSTEPVAKYEASKSTKSDAEKGDAERTSADAVTAPAPPPRPKLTRKDSAFTTHIKELAAAFPDTDADLRRAILVAASNNLEAAFTGMLALSDDTIRPAAYVNEQIENDEQLARNLVMSEQRHRRSDPRVDRRDSRDRTYGQHPPPPRRESYRRSSQATQSYDYDEDDSVYDGFQRGINDTKQAVSSFWGNLKNRLNGEINDDDVDPGTGIYSREEDPLRSRRIGRQRRHDDIYANDVSGSQITRPPHSRVPSSTSQVADESPKLPPRLPSRTSTEERKLREPKKQVAEPEPKSVNVFGDAGGLGKAEDQAQDDFFIGESDDDDLGSLNEETLGEEAKGNTKLEKKTDADADTGVSTAEKSDESDEAKVVKTKNEASKEDKKKDSSARDLLSKMQNDANKK